MSKKFKSLNEFADLLLFRVETKQDAVIIVDSLNRKGLGKSSFSMDLAEAICRKKGFDFDIKKCLVFDATTDKITDLVRTMPECYPIIIDEALKIAFNRNWNERDQKNLIIFLNLCRKFGKIIIINNPSFDKLDKGVRDIADFRVTVLRRGYAVIRRKMAREFGDPWLLKETDDKLMEAEEYDIDGESKDVVGNVLRLTKNFYFETTFPAVNPKVYALYEEMSKEKEMDSFVQAQSDNQRYIRDALIGVINTLKSTGNGFILPWKDIALTVNDYLRLRNSSYIITPDKLTNVLQDLDSVDFNNRCNRVLLSLNEYLKNKKTICITPITEGLHGEDDGVES